MRPLRVLTVTSAALTAITLLPTPAAHATIDIRGVPAVRMAEPCVSMAGELITRPDFPVFIIDREGYRRGINSADTFNRIFRSWDRIRHDFPLELCPERAPLSLDAQLITAEGRPVFLFTNGEKRGITDGRFMDKYHFTWGKVQVVSIGILDAIPEGPVWE